MVRIIDYRDGWDGGGGPNGGGGGGSGGGGGNGVTYADPTVAETGTLQILLSEGTVEGLVDGLKSVYLDGTPIENADGTHNFKGIALALVAGTNTQASVKGITGTESETSVGVQVIQATPVVRTISTNPSAVRVRISIPALKVVSTTDGKSSGNTVTVKIERKHATYTSGAWEVVTLQGGGVIYGGPFSTKYTRSYRIDTPAAGAWDIRVTRVSADDADAYHQSQTWWEAYTEIVDARLRYPNSSVLSLRVNAKQFRSIPQVNVLMKGVKVDVPANYDPVTRVYATTGTGTSGGAWDGTFKEAWTDNPAWTFYAAATKTRYGAGTFLSASGMDKWTLYNIAQWADTLVDDGHGGTEPRMTCNIYIQAPQNAIKALGQLASIFWGVIYYASGLVIPVPDSDDAPVALFTNANVEGGKFSYEGTARQARHTAAIVKFNNPDLAYSSDAAVYEDEAGIARYGYNSLDIQGIGCTSQGQALRLAKWAILSELMAPEIVAFSSGLEGSTVKPGDVVQVADQFRAGNARAGGRIIGTATTTVIPLDAPVTLAAGTYTLRCQTGAGMESRTVTTGAGTVSSLTVSPAYSVAPAEGAGWLLQKNSEASLWRLLSVKKGDGLKHDLIGLKHDPAKYTALGLTAGDVIIRTPIDRSAKAPTNVVLSWTSRILKERQVQTLHANWDLDGAMGYVAQASRDNGTWEDMVVSGASAYLDGVQPGDWHVRVAGNWRYGGLSTFTANSGTMEQSTTVPEWVATAQGDATAAAAAAAAAQASANAANAALTNIASDSILSPSEKPTVVQDYSVITTEQAGIDAQADAYTVSRVAYDSAVAALTAYLGTLTGWNVIPGGDVAIVGTTFRSNFENVYTTRQALLNAIYAAAKALADAAQANALKPSMFYDFSGVLPTGWTFPGTVASGDSGTTTQFTNALVDQGLRVALNVDPAKNYVIAMRVKLVAGPWEGFIYPTNAGHGESALYYQVLPAPTIGVWTTIVTDMRTLSTGGTDYMTGGSVTGLRFDFINAVGASVVVDWIATGVYGAVSQADVDAAQIGVNTINDPDTLTTGEKPQILQDYATLTGEHADLVAKATAYSVSHAAYDAAYTELVTTYLPTLTTPTAWNSLTGTTALGAGNRVALWNPKWLALRSAANDLKAAIASGVFTTATAQAATDAQNKANAAQLASQPHQVAWAYASKPALPSALYPAGYYAITTDSRTVQVNPAGTAWTDVLVAATALVGKLFANQITVTDFDNLWPNGNSETVPAGYVFPGDLGFETGYILAGAAHDGSYGRYVNMATDWMGPKIPCKPGDKFYFEAWAIGSAAGATLYAQEWSDASTPIAWQLISAITTGWVLIKGVITAGATTLFVQPYFHVPGGMAINVDGIYFRRMNAGELTVDGSVRANHLETDLAVAGVIRSPGYTAGTSSAGPVGFKQSGPAFTTTYIGGATDSNCHMELEGTANFGGYKVATVNDRLFAAFNRIINFGGSWFGATGYGKTLLGIASAVTYYPSASTYDAVWGSQGFNLPPHLPSTVNLKFTPSASLVTASLGTGNVTFRVTVSLYNNNNGVTTQLYQTTQTITNATPGTTQNWAPGQQTINVASHLSSDPGGYVVRVDIDNVRLTNDSLVSGTTSGITATITVGAFELLA